MKYHTNILPENNRINDLETETDNKMTITEEMVIVIEETEMIMGEMGTETGIIQRPQIPTEMGRITEIKSLSFSVMGVPVLDM